MYYKFNNKRTRLKNQSKINKTRTIKITLLVCSLQAEKKENK